MAQKKIYYSTLHCKHWSIKKLVLILKKLNILKLELNLTPFIVHNENYLLAKKIFLDNNMQIKILDGGWCSFLDRDKKIYDKSLYLLNKQLNICNEFDCDRIRIFIGNNYNYDDGIKIKNLIAERLYKLLNKYRNINFLFETHDELSCDLDFLNYLGDQINLSNFKILLDPVNIFLRSKKATQSIKDIKEYVDHVHIKGLNQKMSLVPYHKSEVDQIETIKLLNKIKNVTFASEIENLEGDAFTDSLISLHKLSKDLNKI